MNRIGLLPVSRAVIVLASALTLLCVEVGTAQAQWKGHSFGLGLRGGDPTAFSAKYWLSPVNALQIDLGWHWVYRRHDEAVLHYYPGPVLSVDWVHQFTRFGPTSRRVWFGIHAGLGGSIDFGTGACYYDAFGYRYCNAAATARVPIAFNVYLTGISLETFVEVAPGVRFYPPIAPTLSFSLGARYYF